MWWGSAGQHLRKCSSLHLINYATALQMSKPTHAGWTTANNYIVFCVSPPEDAWTFTDILSSHKYHVFRQVYILVIRRRKNWFCHRQVYSNLSCSFVGFNLFLMQRKVKTNMLLDNKVYMIIMTTVLPCMTFKNLVTQLCLVSGCRHSIHWKFESDKNNTTSYLNEVTTIICPTSTTILICKPL